MSPSTLRSWIGRGRRRLVVGIVLLLFAGAAVSHHGDPMAMQMAGGVCVAVLALGAAVAVRRRLGSWPVPLAQPGLPSVTGSVALPDEPEPRARAGPAGLQVFRL